MVHLVDVCSEGPHRLRKVDLGVKKSKVFLAKLMLAQTFVTLKN